MKRILIRMLAALACAAAAGCAGEADAVFEELAGVEWSFSSGVGAWSTDMRILPDGSFSGEFHDSEMGETGEGYPGGTVYRCDFTGRMSPAEGTGENTRKIRVDALARDESQPEEYTDGGVRYVRAEPYGLGEGDEMLLAAPGTPVEAIPEELRVWTHQGDADVLDGWFLYSEKNGSGFVGFPAEPAVMMPNPWEETTAARLLEETGFSFGVPEGAENVVYRYLRSENLAEMQFTLGRDDCCARVRPAAPGEDAPEDISGMYFDWEDEEEILVRGCRGTAGRAKCGSEDWALRCLWRDEGAGLTRSLSVSTTDPDGVDLAALAEQL